MNDIKEKLKSLCIFRQLLDDPVISALQIYLESPSVSAYADFTSALYKANGGDLSAYILETCENSDNIYVRSVGRGLSVPQHMHRALIEELDILQSVASLSNEKLLSVLDYKGFLPEYITSSFCLREDYMHRCENIGKYGYGIYAKNKMFFVDECGRIVPVRNPDEVELSDLVGYEREKQAVIENTKALLEGKPAANILLTGDAGTGKSSTVKAVANLLWSEGLRIIELRKDQLRFIPGLLDELSDNPLKFVLFIDDLSFTGDDDSFNSLKAVLEGSVAARSRNLVIYATSNRRHIVKERFSDREGDDIHRNDTMQELVSLSDRFGIHITFSKPGKTNFLGIVHHLAAQDGVTLPEAELDALAERFALQRGGRSPRLARQFVDQLLSSM